MTAATTQEKTHASTNQARTPNPRGGDDKDDNAAEKRSRQQADADEVPASSADQNQNDEQCGSVGGTCEVQLEFHELVSQNRVS